MSDEFNNSNPDAEDVTTNGTTETTGEEISETELSAEGTDNTVVDEPERKPKNTAANIITVCLVVLLFAAIAVVTFVIVSKLQSPKKTEKNTDTDISLSTGSDSDSNSNADAGTVTTPTATAAPTADADAEVTPAPEFNVTAVLGQYKNIEVTYADITVSEEDVESQIAAVLNNAGEMLDITDDYAREGDEINFNYLGKIDGVPFDNGAAEGATQVLGSGGFIPGFEEEIIAKQLKPGETAVINVTFPDNYSSDLAGKAATFDITVNSIARKKLPELTDAFVSENTDYKTVEEYRQSIRDSLTAQAISSADEQAKQDAFKAVIANATFAGNYEEETEYYYNQYLEYYDQLAYMYYQIDGATLFQYIYGYTADEYHAMIREEAEFNILGVHVLDEIVKAENITYTDEEYNTAFEDLFYKEQGFESKEQILEYYTEEEIFNAVNESILRDKAYAVITDNMIVNK